LLLSRIRTVVEKHGGSLEVDERAETFSIIVPEVRKAVCLRELEKIIGPSKPLSESFSLQ
jgi:hypothetical protein